VKELYQARTEPLRDPKGNPIPCEFCHDLRFKGRMGVFETFAVDDEARDVITAGAQPGPLKAVFRKQKGRYLQEEALSIVERGDTSVQEVLRVLKGGGEDASASPGGGGAAPGTGGTTPPPRAPTRPPARPAAK
jgi:type II secretory ATPase GspE/PulE/Tfp pilus assembly ATPase PilB-like protein